MHQHFPNNFINQIHNNTPQSEFLLIASYFKYKYKYPLIQTKTKHKIIEPFQGSQKSNLSSTSRVTCSLKQGNFLNQDKHRKLTKEGIEK